MDTTSRHGRSPEGDATEAVELANRKYLGSKRLLAPSILDAMIRESGLPDVLLDGFCGTGAVAAESLARGVRRVVAVDNLVSNTVILRGFAFVARSAAGRPELLARICERIHELNGLEGEDGYISRSFGGTYFTEENSRRMDSIRERIELWRETGEIDAGEYAAILAGFLLGSDRVANTVGQYDAYLKHIGRPPVLDGKHLVDGRVYSPFRVLPLAPLLAHGLEVMTGDILALGPSIDAEVAYLDPPYNGRQYCDCYHVLENLARWERPPLAGKTRKFAREGLKSPFSRRREARGALVSLLDGLGARHVYLSYSSEGLLTEAEIGDMLRARGAVTVQRFPYPVFGSGAGVARKREVTELLFHVDRGAREA